MRIEASSTVATDFPYACGSCGYEGRGAVVGEGFAEADELRRAVGKGRREDALEAAEGRAWADALSSVALAPCPRCGARDRGAWRRWLAREAVGAFGFGAGAGGVLAVGLVALGPALPLSRVLLLGLGAALLVTGAMLATTVRAKAERIRGVRIEAGPAQARRQTAS
ncbi:MAG: hypothetical protein AAGH15_10330 [Myxococcota bacterium]